MINTYTEFYNTNASKQLDMLGIMQKSNPKTPTFPPTIEKLKYLLDRFATMVFKKRRKVLTMSSPPAYIYTQQREISILPGHSAVWRLLNNTVRSGTFGNLENTISSFPTSQNITDERSCCGLLNQVPGAYLSSPIMSPFQNPSPCVLCLKQRTLPKDITKSDTHRVTYLAPDWNKECRGFLL